LNRI